MADITGGGWAEKSASLVNRLRTASKLNLEVALDPAGSAGMADLIELMANRLDYYDSKYGNDNGTANEN